MASPRRCVGTGNGDERGCRGGRDEKGRDHQQESEGRPTTQQREQPAQLSARRDTLARRWPRDLRIAHRYEPPRERLQMPILGSVYHDWSI